MGRCLLTIFILSGYGKNINGYKTIEAYCPWDRHIQIDMVEKLYQYVRNRGKYDGTMGKLVVKDAKTMETVAESGDVAEIQENEGW